MDTSPFMGQLSELISRALDRMPQLLLTFVVGYILLKIASTVIRSLIRVSHAKAALKDILMSVINAGLWILLVAALLQQMGLTQLAFALSGFVAFAGLAVTAGTSSLVQDLISGIFLAQDPDFNVGDQLRVAEIEGIIEKMDARKIRLRDKEGKLHVFPNATFDKTAWIVIKKK